MIKIEHRKPVFVVSCDYCGTTLDQVTGEKLESVETTVRVALAFGWDFNGDRIKCEICRAASVEAAA